MICFGTTRNPERLTCDCPILKNLGYKLEKRLGSDSSVRNAASRLATDAGLATTESAPAPAPAPSPESLPGSALTPGAFSASTEPESCDSEDEFDYEGKADGAMYDTGGKHNASFAYFAPSCRIISVEPATGSAAASLPASTTTHSPLMGGSAHFMGCATPRKDPPGVNIVYLPKTVLAC